MKKHPVLSLFPFLFNVLVATGFTQELDENWIVSVYGRSVPVAPDGSFLIPTVTLLDQFGDSQQDRFDFRSDDFLRLTGFRLENGVSEFVHTEPFQLVRNRGRVQLTTNDLVFTDTPQGMVEFVRIQAPVNVLSSFGETLQCTTLAFEPNATATFEDNVSRDVSMRSDFTTYRSTNPDIASVSKDGLVTAHARGVVYISAMHDNVSASIRIAVELPRETILAGILRDPFGNPVGGAEVTASGYTNTTTTATDGLFVIRNLPLPVPVAGTDSAAIVVTAIAPDGRVVMQSMDPILDGITEFFLRLPPFTAQVQGEVVDALGNPAPSVTIHVQGTDAEGLTGPSGAFSLADVPVGALDATLSVVVTALDGRQTTASVPIENGVADLGTIMLPALMTDLAIIVRDTGDIPVEGATVTIPGLPDPVLSDSNGMAAVVGYAVFDPATPLAITTTLPDGRVATLEQQPSIDGTTTFRFDFDPLMASASGRLVDSLDRPVPGATITLQPGPVTSTTDSTGAFVASNLFITATNEVITVVATAPDNRMLTAMVPTANGLADFGTLMLPPFRTELAITVRDTGDIPLENASVVIPGLDDPILTDVNGQVQVPNFSVLEAEDPVAITVTLADGRNTTVELTPVAGGITIYLFNFDPPLASVMGRLVDNQGAPVSAASVVVPGAGASGQTDANGDFAILSVPILDPSRVVTVVATAPDGRVVTGMVAVVEGVADVGTLMLPPLVTDLSIVVVDAAAQPIENAEIVITGETGSRLTDATGSLSLSNFPLVDASTPIEITASTPDGRSATLSMAPMVNGTTEFQFMLVFVRDLAVRVVDETGDPIAAASVVVDPLGLSQATGGSGETTFTGLRSPVEPIMIAVSAFGYVEASIQEVLGMADKEVEVVLSRLSNIGTEFILVFQENADPVTATSEALDLFLFVSAGTNSARVRVEFAADPDLVIERAVAPNSLEFIEITDPSLAVLTEDDGVQTRGLKVLSDNPISLFCLNRYQASTDGFTAIPINALGSEYIIVSYEDQDVPLGQVLPGFPSVTVESRAQLAVLALKDRTTVEITPAADINYDSTPRTKGEPFQVVLNSLQAYQLQTDSNGDDLSGSSIRSLDPNKPIAVFSGSNCESVPAVVFACDHQVEQIPPVGAWQSRFIVTPFANPGRNPGDGGDRIKIVAGTDATTVTIIDDGGPRTISLDRGGSKVERLNGVARILSSSPVLVAQFAGSKNFANGDGDPFMMLIPGTQQFLDSYIFSTVGLVGSTTDHYLNIVAHENDINNGTLLFDGVPIDPDALGFQPIPGTEFQFAAVPLGTAFETYTMKASKPFGLYVYGWGEFDSYGYPGGYALAGLDGGEPTFTITGRIVDGAGATVAAASVSLPGLGLSTTANDEGRFELPSVIAGVGYILDVEADGFNQQSFELPELSGETDLGNFVIGEVSVEMTTTLTGRLLNSLGVPLPGARVSIAEVPDASGTTGIDGTFQLSDVPISGDGQLLEVTLIAAQPDGRSVSGQVTALSDQTVNLGDVAVSPFGTQLSGMVFESDGATPVVGGSVSFTQAGVPMLPAVTTDAAGGYTLPNVPYEAPVSGGPLSATLTAMTIDGRSAILDFEIPGILPNPREVSDILMDPTNRPPQITSTPPNPFQLPGRPNAATNSVSPLPGISLCLDAGEASTEEVSIQVAGSVDIVFIVDQSPSMITEHRWIGGMLPQLDEELRLKGITDAQYALVGFTDALNTVVHSDIGSVSDFLSATNRLRLNAGGREDGYYGIWYALSTLSFRPNAVKNFVLITDEERTVVVPELTRQTTLDLMRDAGIVLNGVLNAKFEDGSGTTAVGVASNGVAFLPNASGGFTTGTNTVFTGSEPVNRGQVARIFEDYSRLAWNTGGAVWDLNQLRNDETNAISFTRAFTTIKAEEIQGQLEVFLQANTIDALFTNTTGSTVGDTNGLYSFSIKVGSDGEFANYDIAFSDAQGNLLGTLPVILNSKYTYNPVATDLDGDPLSWSLTTAPPGIEIAQGTGAILWDTGFIEPGSYPIAIQVSDGRGGTDLQSFELIIQP